MIELNKAQRGGPRRLAVVGLAEIDKRSSRLPSSADGRASPSPHPLTLTHTLTTPGTHLVRQASHPGLALGLPSHASCASASSADSVQRTPDSRQCRALHSAYAADPGRLHVRAPLVAKEARAAAHSTPSVEATTRGAGMWGREIVGWVRGGAERVRKSRPVEAGRGTTKALGVGSGDGGAIGEP